MKDIATGSDTAAFIREATGPMQLLRLRDNAIRAVREAFPLWDTTPGRLPIFDHKGAAERARAVAGIEADCTKRMRELADAGNVTASVLLREGMPDLYLADDED